MKTRQGFVSNSSSSSFIILSKDHITDNLLIDKYTEFINNNIIDKWNNDYPEEYITTLDTIKDLDKRLQYKLHISKDDLKKVIFKILSKRFTGYFSGKYKMSSNIEYVKYVFNSFNESIQKRIIKYTVKQFRNFVKIEKKLKQLNDYKYRDIDDLIWYFECSKSNITNLYDNKLKKLYNIYQKYVLVLSNQIYDLIVQNVNIDDIVYFEIASDCGRSEYVLLETLSDMLYKHKYNFFVIRELYMGEELGGVDRYEQE